ncbi:MAG: hypothetical protein FWG99_09250 [Treponema sp.]|nr:hypothetical protein [Treponema sp.]
MENRKPYLLGIIVLCAVMAGSCDHNSNSEPDIWTLVENADEIAGLWESKRTQYFDAKSEYSQLINNYIKLTIPSTSVLITITMEYKSGDTDMEIISSSDYSKLLDDVVKANKGYTKDVLWMMFTMALASLNEPGINITTGKYYILFQQKFPVSFIIGNDIGFVYINQRGNRLKIKPDYDNELLAEIIGENPEIIFNKKR